MHSFQNKNEWFTTKNEERCTIINDNSTVLHFNRHNTITAKCKQLTEALKQVILHPLEEYYNNIIKKKSYIWPHLTGRYRYSKGINNSPFKTFQTKSAIGQPYNLEITFLIKELHSNFRYSPNVPVSFVEEASVEDVCIINSASTAWFRTPTWWVTAYS